MKTLYKCDKFQLVDNEQDYDFVGWIENNTTSTIAITFDPGNFEYDEEADEIVYDENDWDFDEIVFAENVGYLNNFREYANINELRIIEIEPGGWCGFPADNEGRSMFNALRKALCK